MKLLRNFLLAGTIVGGIAGVNMAAAGAANYDRTEFGDDASSLVGMTLLAQSAEPELKPKNPKAEQHEKKPPAAKPPTSGPPKKPAVHPAQPQQRPGPHPSPSKPPEHPAPPQGTHAPSPKNASPASAAPTGQQPAVQGKPNPPTQHNAPNVTGPEKARPGTPPGAQSAHPSLPTGVTPNKQATPLLPSGVAPLSAQQTRPITPSAAGAGIAPLSNKGQPLHRIDQLRGERHESVVGNRTIIREPDRTIIREGGKTIIHHDESDRFRYGAKEVRVERNGNNNVMIVVRPNGDRIVDTVDEDGFLIRRVRILPDGRQIILIGGDRREHHFDPRIGFGSFFINLPMPRIRIPRDRYIVDDDRADQRLIYETLIAPPVDIIERPYSLEEIRYSAPLRDLMPRIDLDTVTFDTGSWGLTPDQIERLAIIADGLNRAVARNPREVFLIEGFTDAVGSEIDNLSLSDRRAESVAIALTQHFGVPPENLATQGYGEQYLKVPTQGPERANRRVTVQRITPLLTGRAD